MAGIMPDGGVAPNQALNTLQNAELTDGCDSLWHRMGCRPIFDAAAANAVISEILNAVNGAGFEYDCTRLDNLALATSNAIIEGTVGLQYAEPTPFNIPAGNDKNIGSGSFTISNSHVEAIRVLLQYDWTLQVEQTADVSLDINFQVFADSGYTDQIFTMPQRFNSFGPGDTKFVMNPFKAAINTIPPGGKTYWWRIRSSTPGAAGDWKIHFEDTAIKLAVYGVAGKTVGGITGNS